MKYEFFQTMKATKILLISNSNVLMSVAPALNVTVYQIKNEMLPKDTKGYPSTQYKNRYCLFKIAKKSRIIFLKCNLVQKGIRFAKISIKVIQ